MFDRYFRIGVVAPMRVEFNQIAHLQSERILIRRSGIGPARAAAATRVLIGKGCKLIISWGFCGALSDLNVGDIVRAGIAIDAVTNQRFSSSLSLPDTIISASEVADPRRKVDLATSGAVAVDMESAAVARVCVTEKVTFAVLRVVVDDKAADWPSKLERFRDANLTARLGLAIRYPRELSVASRSIYRGKVCLKRLSVELGKFDPGKTIPEV